MSLAQLKHPVSAAAQSSVEPWSVYGGNSAGQHFSGLKQISSTNVDKLIPAWTFHTGALSKPGPANARAAFEANPVIWGRTLYFDSPFDEVFAVDAATGVKRWSFDPGIDRRLPASIITSRGVALWHGSSPGSACNDRVYVATLTAQLIALDATGGQPCGNFGQAGKVNLAQDVALKQGDDYEITSPPTVVGDVVVVGSSIGDNRAVEEEFGIVRGFDARTGRQLWMWDPITWARTAHPRTGAGNAWSALSADVEHGLVYVPTGSASPDFWGGFRTGNNQDANSVVALDAKTGRKVWAFQVVHHDLWDYDVAAEPTLFTFRPAQGPPVAAVAISTKTGMVFVLNRLTGVPLWPVQERPVPQTTMAGERTAATQPFSALPPLTTLSLGANDLSNYSPEDNRFCREKLAGLENRGIYTPVSTRDTLLYPGSVGGVNWGSPAIDDQTGVLYANTNQLAYVIRLVPQKTRLQKLHDRVSDKLNALEDRYFPPKPNPYAVSTARPQFRAPDTGGEELSVQAGAPWRIYRAPFVSPDGLPCTPMPWGSVVALNLNTGKLEWRQPLGTMAKDGRSAFTGAVTLGGPMATGGDLLFSAATPEPVIRAFRRSDGKLLWTGALPAPAQATPMTYVIDGRQFMVIAAGGHGSAGIAQSDAVVAFALPQSGRANSRRTGARQP